MEYNDQLARWMNHSSQFLGGIGAGVGATVLQIDSGISAIIVIALFLFLTFFIKEVLRVIEPFLRRRQSTPPERPDRTVHPLTYHRGSSTGNRWFN